MAAEQVATLEVGELDQELDADHLSAELLDQVHDRPGGPAGGDEVVHHQHLLPRGHGVFVHVQDVGAVLQRVPDLTRPGRQLAGLPDDEIKARLVEIRGLGEWTADWYLARYLARPRAWPAGDLALAKAVRAFYPEAGDIRTFGERFEPFQNLSAHYLLTGARLGT